VKALLDTHVLLWWLVDDARISKRARSLISKAESEIYFSAASSWELSIEVALGRLELPAPPRSVIPKILREQSIRSLDVTHAHALAVAELPPHHRDPFDRMLVAQARLEKLAIVTGDPMIARYGVKVVW
jgi:PIN domain nuclease of toxin-antitoxin system